MVDRYRPELTKGKFDTIVTGSGLGGLTLAALMAGLITGASLMEVNFIEKVVKATN